MRSFREKNVIYTEIQVLRLNKNFETDLKNIGNQGDYIVDCFGGIETFFKLSANKAHYDYIVDCFGGIETFTINICWFISSDYIVDCFGGIETNKSNDE